MYTVIIVLATAFAVWKILEHFGVFEYNPHTKKVVNEVVDNRKTERKRRFETAKLNLYSSITNTFRGILMNDLVYEKHMYYINRLEIRSDILGRLYTPEELRGKYFFPFCASVVIIPLAVFRPFLFAVNVAALMYFMGYKVTFESKIADEDQIIDDYFIDLYLLLYSKLRQGSRARLQRTVENYIDTLQTSNNTEVRDVMLKLARYMLNLLSLYEDHVAIPKLKEVYHSATIINFCNVAAQSLNGIENFDNLLTFKMQLVSRKTEVMRKRSQAIVRKGEMSIYAIYIILVIFIVIGWKSKLPTGLF